MKDTEKNIIGTDRDYANSATPQPPYQYSKAEQFELYNLNKEIMEKPEIIKALIDRKKVLSEELKIAMTKRLHLQSKNPKAAAEIALLARTTTQP